MKIFFAGVCGVFSLWFAVPGRGADPELVDCGKVKVVTFGGAESRDGRYTVGWTIRLRSKKAKAVDWSLWDAGDDGNEKFFARYPWDEGERDNPPYELATFIVDLKGRKAVEYDDGWEPGRTPAVSWSREIDGRQYGFLGKDHHFGTRSFVLIVIDHGVMRGVDLLDTMGDAVESYMAHTWPKKHNENMFFTPGGGGVSPDGGTAWVPFSAEKFGTMEDDGDVVEGFVELKLPKGTIEKVSEGDAFALALKEDAGLAKADDELNADYARLLKELAPAGRAALKKEQRKWIERRDDDATSAGEKAQNQSGDADKAERESLLQSTEKRTAELKGRGAGH